MGRPGPDHGLPPARLAGDRVIVNGVLIAGKRMADQNRIAALGVERAVGLISDLQWAKLDAGIEAQRIAGRKAHDQRMRLIRFAAAVGQIQGRAQLCHDNSRTSAVTK